VAETYTLNAIYYRDLGAPSGEVVRLLDDWDARDSLVGKEGTVI